MLRRLDNRPGHCALLLFAWAALCLPNLGAASLWDIDEGNNAEAAREMLESEDYVVPRFNGQLRVDKPALLYWLQLGAYRVFGIGEFAARLPSALAALLAILVTYHLGRRMFGPAAGLLAGLALASSTLFCAAAHFANPDALLCALTALALFFTWHGLARSGRLCFVPIGVSQGLAVLAKGPVGLLLPLTVTVLFLAWSRRLGLLRDRRLALGALAFVLVVAPWYGWVGAETKANFLSGFLLKHNVGRFLSPMENHRGPVWYYPAVLLLGFAPWSAFLGLAGWYAVKELRNEKASGGCQAPDQGVHASRSLNPIRFLLCWIAVYLVFFSVASTKLPNYILPVYPPVALLTARFLDRWRRGEVEPPGWVMNAGLGGLALVGVATALGVLVASGAVEASFLRGRRLPGLEAWAALGIVPVLGAAIAGWFARQRRRDGVVTVFAATAVVFLGAVAGPGSTALEKHKAPRELARAYQAQQTEREVRVACYRYFQPSLVFYCGRQVDGIGHEDQALEFLRCPAAVYLFVPATVWEDLEGKVRGPYRLLDRRHDLYSNREVVVVTNR